MAPPRPQPLRRGLLAAAELRFQLVELRVDGSLVVLPVAAGKLLAGFRLAYAGADPLPHATVGLNIDFAKLASRASVRARVGRLTYLVSAAYALRERASFTCSLRHDGSLTS
jgi:hypothetical protein